MMAQVTLLDATLREGEQQDGIRLAKEDKIALLHMLENFGVTLIEIGHPGISPEEESICKEVAATAERAEILMHARADIEEIRCASRAKAHWVGIWASVNPISLQAKFTNKSIEDVMQKVKFSIQEAKRLGLKVRFTIEDASRTDWNDIETLGLFALEAGADRISLADTVGVWEPKECARMVQLAVDRFPCEIEVHLHNDFGLAMANALAAIDAGATVIDTSLCGIGERAGIVDLLAFSTVLHQKRNIHQFNLTQIPQLVRMLRLATGYQIDKLKPIVGKNAFTHASTYHMKAVQKNPASYEPIPPEKLGRNRVIVNKPTSRTKPKLSHFLRVGQPFIKGASELLFHRDGPGNRWVQMDHRTDERASFYVIKRVFSHHASDDISKSHVDTHSHHCDSAFIFWGNEPDGSGLQCEVEIEGEVQQVVSPASIFIPAGLEHTYKYLSGSGTYTNIVLAPEYNASLDITKPLEVAK
ncbi:2-isopropylmalate synthase [Brevibacillus laterosporus]|uniref:2-isopropylmalate synthase n=1 Tax=Brevibacillus laterosporus TaxID=1465 RepID=A0A518VEH7_BRELA|nr:2-isopropylmalate synthase [Brevibacillus laterosporus]